MHPKLSPKRAHGLPPPLFSDLTQRDSRDGIGGPSTFPQGLEQTLPTTSKIKQWTMQIGKARRLRTSVAASAAPSAAASARKAAARAALCPASCCSCAASAASAGGRTAEVPAASAASAWLGTLGTLCASSAGASSAAALDAGACKSHSHTDAGNGCEASALAGSRTAPNAERHRPTRSLSLSAHERQCTGNRLPCSRRATSPSGSAWLGGSRMANRTHKPRARTDAPPNRQCRARPHSGHPAPRPLVSKASDPVANDSAGR
jgi:hypothetical protein